MCISSMPAQSRALCIWLALATSLTDWLAGRQQYICGTALGDGHTLSSAQEAVHHTT